LIRASTDAEIISLVRHARRTVAASQGVAGPVAAMSIPSDCAILA
jgi:hypothetical protein